MNLSNSMHDSTSRRQQFINNARQMALTKDPKWLKRLFDKGKIATSTRGFTKVIGDDATVYYEQLCQLITLMNNHYGDNWDIHMTVTDRKLYCPAIIINYDKITITNSTSNERELENLLVYFDLSYDITGINLSTMKGTRLTVKHDEWSNGYLHSHLPGLEFENTTYSAWDKREEIFKLREFCLGSEDMSELTIEINADPFDIQKFELLFMTLDNYVRWESEEGRPFRYMRNIVLQAAGGKFNMSEDRMQHRFDDLFAMMRSEGMPIPANFVYSEERFKIKHDEFFKEGIKNLYIDYLKDHSEQVLCKQGSDRSFYKISQGAQFNPKETLNKMMINGELPFVYISGKRIYFTITELQPTEEVNLQECIVYPKFLNYVSEQLEIHLYATCVNGAGIYALSNSNDNVNSVPEQSEALVF